MIGEDRLKPVLYVACQSRRMHADNEMIHSLSIGGENIHIFVFPDFINNRFQNKTPAQAFTPPADEKKMGTIWIFVYYAVYGSGRGRCRDFLVLKWGGGLNLQIWDLNRAHEKNCFSNTTGFQHV